MLFSKRNKAQWIVLIPWFIAAQMSTASASEQNLSRETKAHAASAVRGHGDDSSAYVR